MSNHLQDLHHHFFAVVDINGLEHLAVLPPAQLPHQLIVLLITESESEREEKVKQTTTCFLQNISKTYLDLEGKKQKSWLLQMIRKDVGWLEPNLTDSKVSKMNNKSGYLCCP